MREEENRRPEIQQPQRLRVLRNTLVIQHRPLLFWRIYGGCVHWHDFGSGNALSVDATFLGCPEE